MDTKKIVLFSIIFFITFFGVSNSVHADQASVTIEVPEETALGSEITIRLTVNHSGNNVFHYVQWVKVMANDKLIGRWNFSASNRPEGVPFTREIKYPATQNLEINAEAYCNIHGSKGPAVRNVMIKE
jgi:desulfoferrodoxin (superoxide reductase-like protein)